MGGYTFSASRGEHPPDGCCDHRAMIADEDLHRHAVENLDRADALLFGR
jgi:hypothetical protein